MSLMLDTPSRSDELACPPRFSTPRTMGRPTYGAHVADIAAKLGRPLMPWQRLVADVALEVDPDTGRLAYRQVVLTVPRQQGKTTLILSVAVHRANAFGGDQVITYAAQTRNAARKRWEEDHVKALQAKTSPFRRSIKVRKQAGSEGIRWVKTGSVHGITSVTETAGHGDTLDLGIIDEAFSQTDDRTEAAMNPAMLTRPQPQLWPVSTAGTAASTYLRKKVDAGRARETARLTSHETPSGIAYFEWSATDDADPDDPATWWSCMPALGHTVTEQAVRDIRNDDATDDDTFRRAYLNQWRDGHAVILVVDAGDWRACADPTVKMAGPYTMALDVSPDRKTGAIAMCGVAPDGRPAVEVVAVGEGTGWMVKRAGELREKWNPVATVLDPASPAGALIGDLQAEGHTLTLTGSRDVAQACGELIDKATQHAMVHRDAAALNAALIGAQTRKLGDAIAFARRTSTSEISPLMAATFALWAWTKFVRRQQHAEFGDTFA